MIWILQSDALSCYENNPLGWLTCALDDLALATGGAEVFGMLVGGMLMLTFYIVSNGRLGAASTITTLVGGIMIPTLPQQHQSVAAVVMFLGLVAGLFSLFRQIAQ